MKRNSCKISSVSVIFSVIWLSLFCPISHAQEDTTFDPFTEAGFNPYREFASEIFTEHIDPFSGSLTLIYTDLYLPGDGGLDLKVQRTYNSGRIWNRVDIFKYNRAQYDFQPLGLGWNIHMGRVVNPYGTGSYNERFPDNPVVVMPDGSTHVLYKKDTNLFITRDYWLYERVGSEAQWKLTLTDGTVYTFEFDATTGSGYWYGPNGGRKQVAQVTRIEDVNGNTIIINYGYDSEPGISYIESIVQNSPSRTITFNYNSSTNVYTSISANSRTVCTYNHIDANWGFTTNKLLSEVEPAEGNSWLYTYYNNEDEDRLLELKEVTFPTGGKTTYNYTGVDFCVGKNYGFVMVDVEFLAVTQKTTSGRDIAGGSWTYSYDYSGSSADNKTTITHPGGKTESYTHWGWNDISNGNVWKVGLLKEKTSLSISLRDR